MRGANQEVVLCPRCSVVFDKKAAKSFETSEITKHYDKVRVKEANVRGKAPNNASLGRKNF